MSSSSETHGAEIEVVPEFEVNVSVYKIHLRAVLFLLFLSSDVLLFPTRHSDVWVSSSRIMDQS